MRVNFKKKNIRYGPLLFAWRNFVSGSSIWQYSQLAQVGVRRYSVRELSVEKEPQRQVLELKWDQDIRGFIKSDEQSNGDEEGRARNGYHKQGALVGIPWGKTRSLGANKRKVRVAPLRSISRKLEDADLQKRDGGDGGQVYMMLSCLRQGDIQRAEDILWKIMEKERQEVNGKRQEIRENNEIFETCLSALLAAQDEANLEYMLKIMKTYLHLLPGNTKIPPARCLAYILHCACENKDMNFGNKAIMEITYDWTNKYLKKIREILQHKDILTEYDLQRIEGVGGVNEECIIVTNMFIDQVE